MWQRTIFSLSCFHRESLSFVRSVGRHIARALVAALFVSAIATFWPAGPVSSVGAVTTTSSRQTVVTNGPVPTGTEVKWVNVSVYRGGKPIRPSQAVLNKIVNSFSTGGWRRAGAPVQNGGVWWQKLVRTVYGSSSGGAGVYIPFHWVKVGPGTWDGCWVMDYNHKALAGQVVRAGETDWCANFR